MVNVNIMMIMGNFHVNLDDNLKKMFIEKVLELIRIKRVKLEIK